MSIVGGEQFAGEPAGRDRQHDRFDLDRRHALGAIDGLTDGFLGLRQIDHAAGLHAARAGMAEADHFDGVGPARQHLLRRMRPQPRDQAGDLARSDIERGDERAAPRRDRLHLRRQAVMEGIHALPSFFFFLSLSASSRACAAAGESRTVTRSGSRRSTDGDVARQKLLVAVERDQPVERLLDIRLRQLDIDAVVEPQIPAPLARPESKRAAPTGCRDSGRRPRGNPWRGARRRGRPPAAARDSGSRRTVRARCRRRR